MKGRLGTRLVYTLFLLAPSGCGAVKERTVISVPPAYADVQTASLEELLDLVNRRYASIDAIAVSRFSVEFTGGSIEDGYFEKYRKAKGYLVAARPDSIYINILNPLTSSSVLAMASRQKNFQVWIPSRNQFVKGRTDVQEQGENPVYNVRPVHLLQGILIERIPSGSGYRYYVEEDQDEQFKYYVLGVLRSRSDSNILELERKIWIERSRLEIRRQQYYQGSELASVIQYAGPVALGDKLLHTSISVHRPVDRYSMAFVLEPEAIDLNRKIEADSFSLPEPPSADVIEVMDRQE